jgi:beta-1,4-N-acetylglucosaminyltransferase
MKNDGNKKKKVLFVCNSGGHLSEMMTLSPLFPEYNSMLLTAKANTSQKIDVTIPVKYVNHFRRKRKNKFLSLTYILINFVQVLYIYLSFRPGIIVTTGASIALLPCYIGKIFFSKIVFIEITAKVSAKTKTGRILEPLADLIIVQWPEMLRVYKKSVYWGITF